MKLKKALKKYKIEIVPPHGGFCLIHYKIGDKEIADCDGEWYNNHPALITQTEEQAVSWLIAGATPLSPMERACKKWPIKVIGTDNPVYQLGERSVFLSKELNPGNWMKATSGEETFTEKKAVTYLVEGYEPELKPFSMVSMLGGILNEKMTEFEKSWHKCPICGKWHRIESTEKLESDKVYFKIAVHLGDKVTITSVGDHHIDGIVVGLSPIMIRVL